MEKSKLVFTVGEAAEALSVGRNAVYNAITSGDLPSIRLGRKRLVSAAALAGFVRQLEQKTPELDAQDGTARRERARAARVRK